eukprot:GFUD01005144.1.p1 GENE.GFUD01005144.1~~GFUD01005144.1.p1  ORF type:complete len:601 (+),score=111.45 GFUD01005144.1:373-2175(+)
MNRRLPVPSLEDICVGRLRRYLSDHCWTVSKVYGGVEMDQIVLREEVLPLHIAELRCHIFENIPWYLDEMVVNEIISGIHEAVATKQNQYNFNTHIPVYKTELYCMVTMVDLIVTPRLRRLDMPNIPKILRTHVTARLQDFTGLQYVNMLLLGFGMDSRNSESKEIVAPTNIISALRHMNLLTHLILPTFCTNNIIRALSITCKDTLTRLEIDHSLRMTDAVVPDMLKLENLRLLSMAASPLSAEALAIILLGLKKLVSLPNGDFLCDSLEWLVYDSPEEVLPKEQRLPQFAIQEFCSSEDYHFHSKKQMELVAQLCPNIAQIKFFYDSEILCEIRTLEKFPHLQDLCLNGGDFNKDPLRPLIENIGHQLKRLEFNHVDSIDRHAIVQMSLCCTKLQSIFFSACSFLDYGALHRELFDYYHAGGLETIEEIELVLLLRDQEAFNTEIEGLIQPFESLEELKISSQCSTSTILFLLLHCPVIKKLFVGANSEITNEALLQILSVNPLKYLEELELSAGENLSMSTLNILLNNCSSLRRLKGLKYWKAMTDEERETFFLMVKKNNLDLDISEILPLDYSIFGNKYEMSAESKEEYRIYFSTA